MSWYNTIEFYVIAGAVAAGAVALAALPQRRGMSVLHMVPGQLSYSGDGAEPALDVSVDDNRRIHIRRRGLPDVSDMGAASLAINVNGFDIIIEERLTFDRRGTEPVDTAEFILDFVGPERYHIRYNSEDTSSMTAFSIPVKEGLKMRRELK